MEAFASAKGLDRCKLFALSVQPFMAADKPHTAASARRPCPPSRPHKQEDRTDRDRPLSGQTEEFASVCQTAFERFSGPTRNLNAARRVGYDFILFRSGT